MIKRAFHTTLPKKNSALPSLYRQQRTLTAAKHVSPDPRIQKALDQKQSMISRRIAKLQVEEKTT